MNPSFASEEVPGLEGPGPDYVALVIEWGDDSATGVSAQAPDHSSASVRRIATVVSALGAIALAAWGLRRLRGVS